MPCARCRAPAPTAPPAPDPTSTPPLRARSAVDDPAQKVRQPSGRRRAIEPGASTLLGYPARKRSPASLLRGRFIFCPWSALLDFWGRQYCENSLILLGAPEEIRTPDPQIRSLEALV